MMHKRKTFFQLSSLTENFSSHSNMFTLFKGMCYESKFNQLTNYEYLATNSGYFENPNDGEPHYQCITTMNWILKTLNKDFIVALKILDTWDTTSWCFLPEKKTSWCP